MEIVYLELLLFNGIEIKSFSERNLPFSECMTHIVYALKHNIFTILIDLTVVICNKAYFSPEFNRK